MKDGLKWLKLELLIKLLTWPQKFFLHLLLFDLLALFLDTNDLRDDPVRKTKGQIRIHSENLDKTSVSNPKKKVL